MPKRKTVGDWGEAIAAKHLAENGYAILARNWRKGHGEIDIIAKYDETFVFVEVRVRRSDAFGSPEETLTRRKQKKLVETAQAYLDENEIDDADWRIDFVALEMDARNRVTRLNHIDHAIELTNFPGAED
jgi:putative endonuclease